MPDFSTLTLEELHSTAWSMLALAVKDRTLHWHLVNVSTLGLDGAPKVRTVVLRHADIETRTLRFHTDSRSAKIRELLANSAIEIHGYDQAVNLQFRLSGRAVIHAMPEQLVRTVWENARAQSRTCYRVTKGPGDAIDDGASFEFATFADGTPDPGKENFRIVEVQAEAFELVSLKFNANRRARFTYGSNSATWLVP